ncbi:SDR family oxidoreductase [Patescibacteria group bacterium]|nr:SDR family oxidoreductase [Patescibacteria group bacterium]
MRLLDKVAIITGGGSGIGKASSYLFAKEGAKVVVAQRTETTGEETVAGIKASGGEAIFVRTDVTKASDVENLIRVTKDTFGKIDILFNNAGIPLGRVPVENIDESLWDQIYAVNVKGIFLAVKYALPEMRKAGGGVIINTASIAAVRPRMHSSAYASSKAAVIVLTKSLAVELAPSKIRVNCINPVVTDTPLMRNLNTGGLTWEEYKDWVVSTIPLGRIAEPEDIAYAALYLASSESSMVTGECINVDGGRAI